MDESSKEITKQLHARYDFVPFDRLDIAKSRSRTKGFLLRIFLLSQMLKWTKKGEHQKLEMLDVLDCLVKKGKIAITSMGIDRDMNYDDLGFKCFIGEGTRYFEHHIITPQVKVTRWYSSEPLKKTERAKLKALIWVKKEALKVWKRRDEYFENRFRCHDLNTLFRHHQHAMFVQTMRDDERT